MNPTDATYTDNELFTSLLVVYFFRTLELDKRVINNYREKEEVFFVDCILLFFIM
jgi:hypothetical protein